mgnify:CR=1 FL=1
MYRSKINANPDVVVQGLQYNILANQHDLQKIQIDNDTLNNGWLNRTLTLFNNYTIAPLTNISANKIFTLFHSPNCPISFYGSVGHADMVIRIDISSDNVSWFDSNFPIVLNSSNEFVVEYNTQAPYIRIRVYNALGTSQLVNKVYASYKYIRSKDTLGATALLDANESFVTIS